MTRFRQLQIGQNLTFFAQRWQKRSIRSDFNFAKCLLLANFASNPYESTMNRQAIKLILIIVSLMPLKLMADNMFSNNMPYPSFRSIQLPNDAIVVSCIIEDPSGMMWMGSKRGLFRYDGYQSYPFYNKDGSDANAIQSLSFIDGNTMAVSTNDGCYFFNIRTEKFLMPDERLGKVGAVNFVSRIGDKLFIGTTDYGLYRYDLVTRRLTHVYNSHGFTTHAYLRAGDNIYFSVSGSIRRYNVKSKRTTVVQAPISYAYDMYYDNDSKSILIGCENGILRYKPNEGTVKRLDFSTNDVYRCITKDRKGNLVCGTANGLFIIDKNGQTAHYRHQTRTPLSIVDNYIFSVYCDSKDNVWVTTNKGVSVGTLSQPYKRIGLPSITSSDDGNLFYHLLVDKHQNYWLGGDNGLLLYHKEGGQWQSRWYSLNNEQWHMTNNNIHDVFQDNEGDVWITSDGSISHYNTATGKLDNFVIERDDGKSSLWAYGVAEDNKQRLWIATFMNGLYVVDKKRLLSSNGRLKYHDAYFKNSKPSVETAYEIYADKRGYIWANTGRRLVRINSSTMEVKGYPVPMDYMNYAYGKLWISTLGKIRCFDTEAEKIKDLPFTAKGSMVYTLKAGGGKMWFTTAKGIYYIDVKTYKIYPCLNPDKIYLSGCYDSFTKQMIFGGDDGFLTCSSSLQPVKDSPTVYVTGLSSDGSLLVPGTDYKGPSSRFLEEIRMKRRGNVTIELSTLLYSMSSRTSFYYRLGDKDTWHAVDNNGNTIHFATLPSGSYNLYLTTVLPDGNDMSGVSTYRLIVPYPWYLSWPMVLLYILLLAASVFGVIYYYQLRSKRKYELKEKEKTMELSRQKMDFFVNMSHELKTPLSLIIAPLSKLISEVKNVTELETLKAINRNAIKLNTLIYRILDFKKMEFAVEDSLLRSHTEVVSLLRECIKNFSQEAELKHVSITLKTDTDSLWMNLDALKIESVINNLLSNAMKYVPENDGKVMVELSTANDTVYISVADNGKGVDNNELHNLFTKFFQGQNAVRGTGIGLFLVKKFVEMHGGRVTAKNDNGLRVSLEIPVSGDNKVETGMSVIPKKENTEHDTSLLIVDDNIEMLDFLTRSFEKNYRCITATDGSEALKKMDKFIPDLVIADEMMPVMDGLTLVRTMRSTQRLASLPVIMLTAKDDEETEMKSIKAGADLFMSKPFDLRKLSLHVVQLIQSRKAMGKQQSLQTIANPDFSQHQQSRDSDEVFLENITRCIEENMQNEDFNVAKLSELVGIDQKKIYRKLKQLIGKTPIAFMKQLRMKKAAVLLKEGSFTVSEVMYLVGYSNASYFSKCFLEEYGVTPSQYSAE